MQVFKGFYEQFNQSGLCDLSLISLPPKKNFGYATATHPSSVFPNNLHPHSVYVIFPVSSLRFFHPILSTI